VQLSANLVASFQGVATALRATEWVGVAVMLFLSGAVWAAIRGSKPGYVGPSARLVGSGALAAILGAMWLGSSVEPLLGAIILAAGCGLSVWGVLLVFGVSWRHHIRPGIIPVLLACTIGVGFALWPRATAIAVILIALWTHRNYRRTVKAVDANLRQVATRALALSHPEAATYLTSAWFQRFAPRASNLALLALAQRARAGTAGLPRARAFMHASDALLRVSALAGNAVDQRLRTDDSIARESSWVRVMTREFFAQALHRTGLVSFFCLVSDLLLATVPAKQETWAERARRSAVPVADPEGYVVGLVADLAARVRQEDIDALRNRVAKDADNGGPDWLAAVALWAERWREEATYPNRDLRLEIAVEVIWGVYEGALGPRPARFDYFDQLRLQAPELVEGSSVKEISTDGGVLVFHLNGMPRVFHELRGSNPLILQTEDGREWAFRQLETADSGVQLVFTTEAAAPRLVPIRIKRKPVAQEDRRPTVLGAVAPSQ
jgi:hypothetical protein